MRTSLASLLLLSFAILGFACANGADKKGGSDSSTDSSSGESSSKPQGPALHDVRATCEVRDQKQSAEIVYDADWTFRPGDSSTYQSQQKFDVRDSDHSFGFSLIFDHEDDQIAYLEIIDLATKERAQTVAKNLGLMNVRLVTKEADLHARCVFGGRAGDRDWVYADKYKSRCTIVDDQDGDREVLKFDGSLDLNSESPSVAKTFRVKGKSDELSVALQYRNEDQELILALADEKASFRSETRLEEKNGWLYAYLGTPDLSVYVTCQVAGN